MKRIDSAKSMVNQQRLDNFFTVKGSTKSSTAPPLKRKVFN